MYGAREEAVPVNPPFEIVLRGFDRQQVMDHFGALKARVATLVAERDAALQRASDLGEQLEHQRRETAGAATEVDRLRREAAEVATQVDRLQQSPLTAASERIQRMLQMAVDEAAELQTSAEQETTTLRESAQAEADRLLRATREQCERMEAETRSRLQTADTDFAARRQQAEVDSERRRLAAERQSAKDIARREAETDAWVSDYQIRGIAALHLLLCLAGERQHNRVAEIKRQATALKRLRTDIADQVSAVHRLLVEAVDLVDQPTAAEQAEADEQAVAGEVAEAGEVGESGEDLEAGKHPGAGKHAEDGKHAEAGEADPFNQPRMRRQWGQQGSGGWSEHPDQATAQFGLHP